MAEELKTYLGLMEQRTASLITGEVGSLHSEISEVRAAIGRMDQRLDRQGFMLAGGTKTPGGLLEHVVNVETNHSRVLSEVSELRTHVDRLEKRAP